MGFRWVWVALVLVTGCAGERTRPEAAGTGGTTQAAPATRQARPRVSFYGIESEGERVVFILDHSGSMIENLDFLKQEVRRSVEALRPTQRFGVVFFSDASSDDAEIMGGKGVGGKKLLPATEEHKKATLKEVDKVVAQGGTSGDFNDLAIQAAFTKALTMTPGPDVVFFLTDGHFDSKVIASVRELNTEKARIHTLAFVNDKEPEYVDQLQEIAWQNGGKFRFVAEGDLGKSGEGK